VLRLHATCYPWRVLEKARRAYAPAAEISFRRCSEYVEVTVRTQTASAACHTDEIEGEVLNFLLTELRDSL
jgi:hypothetical protein